jgi:hypothetical protein
MRGQPPYHDLSRTALAVSIDRLPRLPVCAVEDFLDRRDPDLLALCVFRQPRQFRKSIGRMPARSRPDFHGRLVWRPRRSAAMLPVLTAKRRLTNRSNIYGLFGWGGRIRTSAWRNQKPSLSTENQSLSLKEAVNPAPGNQRLTDILSNLFRPHRRVSRMPGDRGKEHRAAGVI